MRINNTEFNADLMQILEELVAQLRANGIPLIQKYKDGTTHIQVCCPYHNNGMERRPSAGIRKIDGKFHCFVCNEVHELPEVISHCFGYDDILGKFGWNWLLKNFATVEVEERKDVELDLYRTNSRNRLRDGNDDSRVHSVQYVSEEELSKYRWIHDYMYARGLTDEIIDLFDVGYDAETKCVTFPVRDKEGNCLFVARRSVHTKWFNIPTNTQKPLYGLFELYSLKCMPKEIIVCEGMIDALTAWVYGKYAVAMFGLGTELQFEQLRKLPCRKLILATDNDSAGMKARDRIRENVTNKIITEYIIPEGKKDINDLTKEEFDNLHEVF